MQYMGSLRASPTAPPLLKNSCSTRAVTVVKYQYSPWRLKYSSVYGKRRLACTSSGNRAATTDGELEIVEKGQGQDGYLAKGYGWGVRRMALVREEMRSVAAVQAEAFHEPLALFNDFFFEFFKAEVLAALIYRVRNSASDRYACLVAESIDGSDSLTAHELVGVVDVTVQRDSGVLQHLEGTEEYLYVSGIAVLIKFRRQKIATVLLEACDVLSRRWGFNHLVLRAYEEDSAAQKLYTKAGYRVVATDPYWMAWMGRKRRVLMIKRFTSHSIS